MSIEQVPTILVAYPKGFSSYRRFEKKVSNILSTLPEFHLAFFSDDNQFISRYFSSDMRLLGSPSSVDMNHIDKVTHAIIFNDGSSYSELIELIKRAGVKSRIIDTRLTTVVNVDKGEKFDVYIGRGSKWGNPYAIGFDGDRDEVIQKYKYDFEKGFLKFTKEDVLELKGKTLGCHCKPAACHGDVLAEYLNTIDDDG